MLVKGYCVYIINKVLLAAGKYGISLLVFNSTSHSFAALACELSSWTLEEKLCIYAHLCIILYISGYFWWSRHELHSKSIWYIQKLHASQSHNPSHGLVKVSRTISLSANIISFYLFTPTAFYKSKKHSILCFLELCFVIFSDFIIQNTVSAVTFFIHSAVSVFCSFFQWSIVKLTYNDFLKIEKS